MGDREEEAHKQALFDLDRKYADVVTLEEATSYLAGLPARADALAGAAS